MDEPDEFRELRAVDVDACRAHIRILDQFAGIFVGDVEVTEGYPHSQRLGERFAVVVGIVVHLDADFRPCEHSLNHRHSVHLIHSGKRRFNAVALDVSGKHEGAADVRQEFGLPKRGGLEEELEEVFLLSVDRKQFGQLTRPVDYLAELHIEVNAESEFHILDIQHTRDIADSEFCALSAVHNGVEVERKQVVEAAEDGFALVRTERIFHRFGVVVLVGNIRRKFLTGEIAVVGIQPCADNTAVQSECVGGRGSVGFAGIRVDLGDVRVVSRLGVRHHCGRSGRVIVGVEIVFTRYCLVSSACNGHVQLFFGNSRDVTRVHNVGFAVLNEQTAADRRERSGYERVTAVVVAAQIGVVDLFDEIIGNLVVADVLDCSGVLEVTVLGFCHILLGRVGRTNVRGGTCRRGLAVEQRGVHRLIEDEFGRIRRKKRSVGREEVLGGTKVETRSVVAVACVEEIESKTYAEYAVIARLVIQSEVDVEVVRRHTDFHFRHNVGQNLGNGFNCVGSNESDDKAHETRARLQYDTPGVNSEDNGSDVGVGEHDIVRTGGFAACCGHRLGGGAALSEYTEDTATALNEVFEAVCGHIDFELRARTEQPGEVEIKRGGTRLGVGVVIDAYEVPEVLVAVIILQPEPRVYREVNLGYPHSIGAGVFVSGHAVVAVFEGDLSLEFEENFGLVAVADYEQRGQIADDSAENVAERHNVAADLDELAVVGLDILAAFVLVVTVVQFRLLTAGHLGVILERDVILKSGQRQAAAESKAHGVQFGGIDVLDGLRDVEIEHTAGSAADKRLVFRIGHELALSVVPQVQDFLASVDIVGVIGNGGGHPSVGGFVVLIERVGIDTGNAGNGAVGQLHSVFADFVRHREVHKHIGVVDIGGVALFAHEVPAAFRGFVNLGVNGVVLNPLIVSVFGQRHVVDNVVVRASHVITAVDGVVVLVVRKFVLSGSLHVKVADDRVISAPEVDVRRVACHNVARSLVNVNRVFFIETDTLFHLFRGGGDITVIERGGLGQIDGQGRLVIPQVKSHFDEGVLFLERIHEEHFGAVELESVDGVVQFAEHIAAEAVGLAGVELVGADHSLGDAVLADIGRSVTYGLALIRRGSRGEQHVFTLDVDVSDDGGDGVIVRRAGVDLCLVLFRLRRRHRGAQFESAVRVIDVIQTVAVVDVDVEAGIGKPHLLLGSLGSVGVVVVVDVGINGEIGLVVHIGEQVVFTREHTEQIVQIIHLHKHLNEGTRHSDTVEERLYVTGYFARKQRQFVGKGTDTDRRRSDFVTVGSNRTRIIVGSQRFGSGVGIAHKSADEVLQFGQSHIYAGLTEITEVDVQTGVLADVSAEVVGIHIRSVVAVSVTAVDVAVLLDFGDEFEFAVHITVSTRFGAEEVGVFLFRAVGGSLDEFAADEIHSENVVHRAVVVAVRILAVGYYSDGSVDELEQVFETDEVVDVVVFVVQRTVRVGLGFRTDNRGDCVDEGDEVDVFTEAEQLVVRAAVSEVILSVERTQIVEEGSESELERNDYADFAVEVAAAVACRGDKRFERFGIALEEVVEQVDETDVRRVFVEEQIKRNGLADSHGLGGVEVHIGLEFVAREQRLALGDERQFEVLDSEVERKVHIVCAEVEFVAFHTLINRGADGNGSGQFVAPEPVCGLNVCEFRVTPVVLVGFGRAEQTVNALFGVRESVNVIAEVILVGFGVTDKLAVIFGAAFGVGYRRVDCVDIVRSHFDGHETVALEVEISADFEVEQFVIIDGEVKTAFEILIDEVLESLAADIEEAEDIAQHIVAYGENSLPLADEQADRLLLQSERRVFDSVAAAFGGETFGGSASVDDDGIVDVAVEQEAEVLVNVIADERERDGNLGKSQEVEVEIQGHTAVVDAEPLHFRTRFVGEVVQFDVNLGLSGVEHIQHNRKVEADIRRRVALRRCGHIDDHSAEVAEYVFEESAEIEFAFGDTEFEFDRSGQTNHGIVERNERNILFAVRRFLSVDVSGHDVSVGVFAELKHNAAEFETDGLSGITLAEVDTEIDEDFVCFGRVESETDVQFVEDVGYIAEVGHKGDEQDAENRFGDDHFERLAGSQHLHEGISLSRGICGSVSVNACGQCTARRAVVARGNLYEVCHELGEVGHERIVFGDAEDTRSVKIQTAVLDIDTALDDVVAFLDVSGSRVGSVVPGEIEIFVEFEQFESNPETGHFGEECLEELGEVKRAVGLARLEIYCGEFRNVQPRGKAEAETRGRALVDGEIEHEVLDVDGEQRADERVRGVAEVVNRVAVDIEVHSAHHAEHNVLGTFRVGGGAVDDCENVLDNARHVGVIASLGFAYESIGGSGELNAESGAETEINRNSAGGGSVQTEFEQFIAVVLRLQFEREVCVLAEEEVFDGDFFADELTEHERKHFAAQQGLDAEAALEQVAVRARNRGLERHALDYCVDKSEQNIGGAAGCGSGSRTVCGQRLTRGTAGGSRQRVDEPHRVDCNLGAAESGKVDVQHTLGEIDIDGGIVERQTDVGLDCGKQFIEIYGQSAREELTFVCVDRLFESLPFRSGKRDVFAVLQDVRGTRGNGVGFADGRISEYALEVARENGRNQFAEGIEGAAFRIHGIDRFLIAFERNVGAVRHFFEHFSVGKQSLGFFCGHRLVIAERGEVEQRVDVYADVGRDFLGQNEFETERVEQRGENVPAGARGYSAFLIEALAAFVVISPDCGVVADEFGRFPVDELIEFLAFVLRGDCVVGGNKFGISVDARLHGIESERNVDEVGQGNFAFGEVQSESDVHGRRHLGAGLGITVEFVRRQTVYDGLDVGVLLERYRRLHDADAEVDEVGTQPDVDGERGEVDDNVNVGAEVEFLDDTRNVGGGLSALTRYCGDKSDYERLGERKRYAFVREFEEYFVCFVRRCDGFRRGERVSAALGGIKIADARQQARDGVGYELSIAGIFDSDVADGQHTAPYPERGAVKVNAEDDVSCVVLVTQFEDNLGVVGVHEGQIRPDVEFRTQLEVFGNLETERDQRFADERVEHRTDVERAALVVKGILERKVETDRQFDGQSGDFVEVLVIPEVFLFGLAAVSEHRVAGEIYVETAEAEAEVDGVHTETDFEGEFAAEAAGVISDEQREITLGGIELHERVRELVERGVGGSGNARSGYERQHVRHQRRAETQGRAAVVYNDTIYTIRKKSF